MNLLATGDLASLASPAPVSREPALLSLEGVTKSYGQGDRSVQVLHGVSLEIMAGEFVAIVGASGSGKSTLMNILGCLDRPTEGAYRVAGTDVAELDSDGRAALRRQTMGFVFQQYNLIPTATALENVEMPGIYLGMPIEDRHERAEMILATLGLDDRTGHRPGQLSGGQQQRVSIARALMNGGRVILADEPTGALDSRTGREVMALLADLNRDGHTIVLITHDHDIAAHARRIIEIRDGRIVSDLVQPEPPTAEARSARPAARLPVVAAPTGGPALLPLIWITLLLALRAMRAHVLRTILTLLGIVVGVAAVVTMLAVGDGARQAVMDRMSTLGPNLLVIRPGAPGQRGAGGINTLTAADAEALAELPGVLAALPENQASVNLRAGGMSYQSQVLATMPELPLVKSWPVAAGTFVTLPDNRSYAPIAVLGQTVARLMFPDLADPVGRYLLMNNVPFQVVGVMAAKGATPWGSDQDDIVMVPLSTGTLRLMGSRNLRSITVAAADVGEIERIERQANALMAERHGTVDFQIRNMASVIETARATQDTMTILLGSIAAISLLVGGIGVMNIMLVTVTERTREIGVRMAVGARAIDIRRQFLLEASLVSAIGGVIGVAIGVGLALALAWFGTSILLKPGPALLALACALGTGVVFGYAPARKASQLDPIAALQAD